MVIATDSTDAARNKMGVPGILSAHEDAIAAEDGGRAVTLRDLPVGKVDFRVNAEAAYDPCDRIPRHIDQPVIRSRRACAF